jgi:electron transfer flavoprotein beta subunit
VNIVVLVTHPPPAGALGPRAGLDEADERALDQARRIAVRRRDVRVAALAAGAGEAVEALRGALARGADTGIHVLTEVATADPLAASRVLAAAVRRHGFDLVLCGTASTGCAAAVLAPMLAERLGVPALCFADALAVREATVEIRRDDGACGDGAGLGAYAARLPAVVSLSERCGEPRYPSFAAAVEARYKPVATWSLADLGLAGADLDGAQGAGEAAAPGAHLTVRADPTSAAIRVADFLAERQFL